MKKILILIWLLVLLTSCNLEEKMRNIWNWIVIYECENNIKWNIDFDYDRNTKIDYNELRRNFYNNNIIKQYKNCIIINIIK